MSSFDLPPFLPNLERYLIALERVNGSASPMLSIKSRVWVLDSLEDVM